MRALFLLLAAASVGFSQSYYTNSGWVYTLNASNEATITEFNGQLQPSAAVVIPASFEGLGWSVPVRQVGSGDYLIPQVFRNMEIKSVTIPDSVERIGRMAFGTTSMWGNSWLTNVALGNGVTNIGDSAFLNCVGLRNATFGSGLKSIGSQAFDGCGSLTNLTLPDNVTTIGSEAFAGCVSLMQVDVGSGVSSIGSGAFADCRNLSNFTIPDSVTNIQAPFYGCAKLSSVTIGSGVTNIGGLFNGCTGLLAATIPDSVTSSARTLSMDAQTSPPWPSAAA